MLTCIATNAQYLIPNTPSSICVHVGVVLGFAGYVWVPMLHLAPDSNLMYCQSVPDPTSPGNGVASCTLAASGTQTLTASYVVGSMSVPWSMTVTVVP